VTHLVSVLRRLPPPLFLALLVPLLVATPHASAVGQSLGGSRASVDRMHRHAVAARLRFYPTAKAVRGAARAGRLERLSGTGDYRLKEVSLPYALPETRTFVERLSAQYRAACGSPLVVTSAVRPTAWMPPNGSDRSVHPSGMAVDLRRPRGRCLAWLRRTLVSLERTGVIEATEERHPAHFHVAVYPRPYLRYVRGESVRRGKGVTRSAEGRRAGRRVGERPAR
jgi:hypothetical protein